MPAIGVVALLVGGVRADAANLLKNDGSFEAAGVYSFSGWGLQNATQASAPTTAPGGGSFAAQISYGGSGTTYQVFANPKPVTGATAGDAYTASAWVVSSKKVCLTLKESTSGGVAVGSSPQTGAACTPTTGTAGLLLTTQYSVTATGNQLGLVVAQPASPVAGDRFTVDTVSLALTAGSTDGTAPSVPGGLAQSGSTSSSVTIHWNASTDPDDDASTLKYEVYRDGGATPVATVSATSYTDTGLSSGESHTYSVDAIDPAGNRSDQTGAITATADTTVDTTAPSTPANLRQTGSTSTSITIGWDASTDTDDATSTLRYDVYRDGGATPIATVSATSYTNTGLSSGESHTYSVDAVDPAGNHSDPTTAIPAQAGTVDTTAPSVPTGLTQTGATATTITIGWNASTDPDDPQSAIQYHVYRGTTLVGTVDTTSYTDTGRAPNTSYGYRVSAFDPAGNTSAKSTSKTAKTAADTTPPSVPTGVTATGTSGTQIKVSWAKSTDPEGTAVTYRVFRDGGGTAIATGLTTLTYTDGGLAQGSTHSYTVVAVDKAGNASDPSAPPASGTTLQGDGTAPTVPGGLKFTGNSTTSVSISWTASTDPDDAAGTLRYTVYRGGVAVGTTNAGVTSFTDNGLASGTNFSYAVSSSDAAGNASAKSGTLATFTQAAVHAVSLWHMNETSGTTAADAVGGHTGTLKNVTLGTPGVSGTSFTFNGSSQQSTMTVASVAALNPGTANLTASLSVKFTLLPSTGDYDILRKGAATIGGKPGTEYKLELLPSGKAYCELRGTTGHMSITGTKVLNDGAWHSITCSRTGISSMSLTVDGVTQTASTAGSIGSISNSLAFYVGGSLNPVQDFYRGQIDEVSYSSG